MEKVRPSCGQPWDRGRLKIRSDQVERRAILRFRPRPTRCTDGVNFDEKKETQRNIERSF